MKFDITKKRYTENKFSVCYHFLNEFFIFFTLSQCYVVLGSDIIALNVFEVYEKYLDLGFTSTKIHSRTIAYDVLAHIFY